MKVIKLFSLIFSFLLIAEVLSAQCAIISFDKPRVVGNKFRVTISMKSCFQDFRLGSNNFRFNYDTQALSNPAITSDLFPSNSFGVTTTTGTLNASGIMSANTSYTGGTSQLGIPISVTAQDLVEIEFDIVNSLEKTGLVWRLDPTFPNPKTALITDDLKTISIQANNLDIYPSTLSAAPISGKIYLDIDKNCSQNTNDFLLRQRKVKASNPIEGDFFGFSDNTGFYEIFIQNKNVPYTLSMDEDPTIYEPCQNAILVQDPQSSANQSFDFLIKSIKDCSNNAIDVVSIGQGLRRCTKNLFAIKYRNLGVIPSLNTYIILTLDKYLRMESATRPYTNLGNQQFRFEIGTLGIEEFGSFNITATLDCDSTILGQTHCVKGEIFPKSDCEVNQGKPALVGVCENGKANFNVKNQGLSEISGATYTIIEDDMIFKQSVLPTINPLQSYTLETAANGSTWRLEIRKNNNLLHSTFVEGCGTNTQGKFSTGFATQFPLPEPSISEDTECKESIGSFDPNDKEGLPKGNGVNHYIEQNTPIEYTIRFQNTGNDTAFAVVIEDVLDDQLLDISSVKVLASSHDVTTNFKNRNTLVFDFKGIMLPDSFKSKELSNGFVRFLINQNKDVQLGSVIKNKVGIYFDFNAPVITNETFHTVGRDFLMVKSQELFLPNIEVVVRPNPMNDKAILEVKGLDNSEIQLEIFDLLGRNVWSKSTDNQYFEISKGQIKEGFYMYRIFQNKQLIASGKILVE